MRREIYMVQSLTWLWSFITVFFNDYVFSNNLFLGLIVLTSIFAVIYIFMWLLDSDSWRW